MNGFATSAAGSARAYRISPGDTNYFAVLFAPEPGGVDNVYVIEIFEPGGKTPPNRHRAAHEFFFVLSGTGMAYCGDRATHLAKGDALLLRPGYEHVIENTGSGKLYTLTVMTPDEEFAALILGGTPVQLDEEDLGVLVGSGP